MAIVPAHFEIREDVVRYQALGKLLTLATEVANTRRLNSVEALAKRKQCTQIRLWLKALDYKDYLTKEQRDQIKYALVDIADVFDFGTAPILANVARPAILIGSGGGTTIINNTSSDSTSFENTDVDIGTENVDTFAYSLGTGAVWFYTIVNAAGTAKRSGMIIGTWLADGSAVDCSDESTPDVGLSTVDVTLSIDTNSGNVRLRATTLSNNWVVSGKRFIIP